MNILYIYQESKKEDIDPSNVLGNKKEDKALKEELMKGKITILRRSKFNITRSKVVNLLMINKEKKNHCTCIKNMSRLLTVENSKHNGASYICNNFLTPFNSEKSRDEHYTYCIDHDAVKVEMPSCKEKWIKYCDGQNQFKVPLTMYADFESILKPMDERYKEKMKAKRAKRAKRAEQRKQAGKSYIKSYTEHINQHVPSGFAVFSKFAYGDVPDPLKIYRGKDCVEEFVEHLEKEVERLYNMFPQKVMTSLTEEEQRSYKDAREVSYMHETF